jgi:hypothetical protein
VKRIALFVLATACAQDPLHVGNEGSDAAAPDASADAGACQEGDEIACYPGPAGTENIGACHAGKQTCHAGAFGPCAGAVVPVSTAEACGTFVDTNCDGKLPDPVCQGQSYWQSDVPNTVFNCAVALSNGNLAVAGVAYYGAVLPIYGAVTNAQYTKSIAVVYVDASGNALAANVWSHAGNEYPIACSPDASGGMYILASGAATESYSITSGFFLERIDSKGQRAWATQIHMPWSAASLTTDAAGNPVLTGWVQGTFDFGCGAQAYSSGTGGGTGPATTVIAEYDQATGSCLHAPSLATQATSAVLPSIESVAALPSGGVVVSMTLQGSAHFGGTQVDAVGATDPWGQDAVLGAYQVDGTLLWFKHVGASGVIAKGGAVAADPAGNVYWTVQTNGAVDMGGGAIGSASSPEVFAKYDALGKHQTSKAWATKWKTSAPDVQGFNAAPGNEPLPAVILSASSNAVAIAGSLGAIDLGIGSTPPPPKAWDTWSNETGASFVGALDPSTGVARWDAHVFDGYDPSQISFAWYEHPVQAMTLAPAGIFVAGSDSFKLF